MVRVQSSSSLLLSFLHAVFAGGAESIVTGRSLELVSAPKARDCLTKAKLKGRSGDQRRGEEMIPWPSETCEIERVGAHP